MKEEQFYLNKDNEKMQLIVYKPDGWSENDQRAGVLFFFGGGFVKRNLKHFETQSEYLTKQGYVCFCADYRLLQETKTMYSCFEDGVFAVKEIRARAKEFGIHPDKIAVCGGSAGGAIACIASMETQIPCCQVLLNPKLDMVKHKIRKVLPEENGEEVTANILDMYDKFIDISELPGLSACQRLGKETVPATLMLVGTEDDIAYHDVLYFQFKAEELGLDCETVLYKGEFHGFFNYHYAGEVDGIADVERDKNIFCYEDTLARMHQFIKAHTGRE